MIIILSKCSAFLVLINCRSVIRVKSLHYHNCYLSVFFTSGILNLTAILVAFSDLTLLVG